MAGITDPTVWHVEIVPVPILDDNYVWMLRRGDQAVAVDPGDAGPVTLWLDRQGCKLVAILVTHRHADHVAGIPTLHARWACEVYGPAGLPGVTQPVSEGMAVVPAAGWPHFDVWALPGHTPEHLGYVAPDLRAVFCGDTLFACGCGRIFDGTAAQLWTSLARLRSLPDDYRLYPTHEYTLANQRFAQVVEPDNAALATRMAHDQALRANGMPTVPTTVAAERASNPFLRWDAPAVMAAARQHGATSDAPAAVFAALRGWKDAFR